MKKGIIAAIMLSIIGLSLSGCGPKMASQETLAKLNQVCSAADAAQQQIQQVQAQIDKLQQEKGDKQKQLQALKAERDSLRAWLDLLEKGY